MSRWLTDFAIAMLAARDAGPASPASEAAQLRNYAAHAPVFEQVTAMYGSLLTATSMYVAVTGALWAVLVPDAFGLASIDRAAGYGIHVLVSAAAYVIVNSFCTTIRQRLVFLNACGERYWPDIEALGVAARERAGRWGIRRQTRIWPLIPLGAGLVSLALATVALTQVDRTSATCTERLSLLMAAESEIDLARARFLVEAAGCGRAGLPAQDPPALDRAPVQ